MVEDQGVVNFVLLVLLVYALVQCAVLVLQLSDFGAQFRLTVSEAHIFDAQLMCLLSQPGVFIYHFFKWAQDILNTRLTLLSFYGGFWRLASELRQVLVTSIVLAAHLLVLQTKGRVSYDVHQFGRAELVHETLNGVVR